MKRIISLICMIAVLCTVFTPGFFTIEAKAAGEVDWYSYWKTTKGSPRITESGTVIIPTGSEFQYTGIVPQKYTVEFSLKVRKYSTSIGLQGKFGVRPGGYIRDGYVGSMSGGFKITTEGSAEGWHDYKFLVDRTKETQKLYYDGIYAGEWALQGAVNGNVWVFWAESNGEFEVDDVKFTEVTGEVAEAATNEEMTVPAIGYTQPFFHDFYDLDGVKILDDTNGVFVKHNAEEGIITIDRERGQSKKSYVDIPLKPPTNFDMEYRLKKYPTDPKYMPGTVSVEISTDDRHTWFYLGAEGTSMRHNAEYREDPFYDGPFIGIPHAFPIDSQWHTLKAEIRDEWITWYIDGEEIATYEYMYRNGTSFHTAVGGSPSMDNLAFHLDIDWIKYTPYFDEELKMTSPKSNSDVLAGSDVFLRAETTLDAEKIDYYVNTAYVGSGYKNNGYAYTLKNVKAGRYRIIAKVGEVETSETIVNALNQYDGRLTLTKSIISLGETLGAKAEVGSLADGYKGVKAEFYVNGQLYFTDTTAPFEAEIKNLRIGTNSVVAKVYDNANICVQTNTENVDVSYATGAEFEIGREYELNYDYTSGTGTIHLNDGYFDLSIINNKDGITYVTDKGAETYKNIGYGEYKVVVTAGHAEIYWKNQFLQSILLPYKPAKAEFTSAGVTNLTLGGSGVKTEIAGINWTGNMTTWSSGPLLAKEQYYYSLEFDKKDTSTEEVYISDGHYNATLYFREDGIYALRQLRVNVPPTELKLTDEVKPGYYRLTVGHGVAQLHLNNVNIGNFRFIDYYAAQSEIKRTMSNPSSSSVFVLKNSNDVYYHNDDFENTTELPSEDYWYDSVTNFRLSGTEEIETARNEENGNHFTTLEGSGVYILNAADKYPQLKWRGRVEEDSGRIFAIIRMGLSHGHEKIGYDFATKSWFHETIRHTGHTTNQDSKLDPGALKAGEWYDFEVKTEDFFVTLLVNGKEVFKTRLEYNLDAIWFGKFGIGVQKSKYSFDDFEYKGEHRVSAGARNYVAFQFKEEDINSWNGNTAAERPNTLSPSDFWKLEDGSVYAYNSIDDNTGLRITDGGRTWEKYVGKNPVTMPELSNQVETLPDGTMVEIINTTKQGMPQYSRISKDGGKTWSEKYLIHDGTYGYCGTGDRTRTIGNKVFTCFESGMESYTRFSVFYTEDGINWHQSNPEFITSEAVGGIVINEMFIIDTPDGEVRIYGRSNTGFVVYLPSYDGGKTFETEWHYTSLPQCECAFSIKRDENDANTYYVGLQFNTEPVQQTRGGSPRTRYSLLVSHDGMESWEFVSDLVTTSSVSVIRMSDLLLQIIDNVAYYKVNCIEGYGGHQVGSQDLGKIKSVKRYPQYNFIYYLGHDVATNLADKHCVISKDKGTGWYYGTYSVSSVRDGRADLATIENIFGVTASKSGNSVTLGFGDGKVTFTEGSKEYDNNGVKGTAEREILVDGYLDLKTLSGIYGKVFREAENSYVFLDKAQAVHPFQTSVDDMV